MLRQPRVARHAHQHLGEAAHHAGKARLGPAAGHDGAGLVEVRQRIGSRAPCQRAEDFLARIRENAGSKP